MLFVLARSAVGVLCVMTATYATLNCSSFAFDMFIRPQLFPWITTFVNWHHLWTFGAFVVSLVTVSRAFRWRTSAIRAQRTAYWASVGYAAVAGAAAAHMLSTPLLPRLWGDGQALAVAVASMAPLAWLSVIDHLSAFPLRTRPRANAEPSEVQARLLLACLVAAAATWASHMVRAAWLSKPPQLDAPLWALTGVWTLALTAVWAMGAYSIAALIVAVSARTRAREWWQQLLATAVVAIALAELLRRTLLPTISVEPGDAAAIAAAAGTGMAMLGAGMVIRSPARAQSILSSATDDGKRAARTVWRWTTMGLLLSLPWVSGSVIDVLAPWDWAFAGQRLLALAECSLAAFLGWAVVKAISGHRLPTRGLVVLPVLALALFASLPHAALRLAAWTGDRRFEPSFAFDRYAAAIPEYRFAADAALTRPGLDGSYYRFLQSAANSAPGHVVIPNTPFPSVGPPAAGPRPDIFLIVLDSLRRDYLSPYNPAATFTPNIGAFSQDSHVFRNAFTRHGATQLAAPSIWAGSAVTRGVLGPGFERFNALEAFINAEGYRLVINDFTIAPYIRASTPSTFLDPSIPSVDTDLCRNVQSLLAHLDATAGDRRPVFTYLSPMNLHVLNTRGGGGKTAGQSGAPMFPPYVAAMRRVDECFGAFVEGLKARDRFDDSVIVVTSDHGDNLGENGYWGHATWIFPEVVQVPLIIRLPKRLNEASTTDLSRVAFTADLAPTFYALLGRSLGHLGDPYGSPLFAPRAETLADRRRGSYLLTSSYGAAFGLLRRNGRQYYISDLVERREFAYELSENLLSVPAYVTPEERRTNEQLIRRHVETVEAFYGQRR